MRRLKIIIAAVSIAFPVFSEEPADTIGSVDLQELLVEGNKMVRKAGSSIYYVSSANIENSGNTLELLQNVSIPSVVVNDVIGYVQSNGQPVQLRINGHVASVEQVRALPPESVRKIEWIDNPGLRYNGTSSILNFIVKNPSNGGSLFAQARQSVNQGWGNYQADAKLNHGKSQWGIEGYLKLTEDIDIFRDYKERYTYHGNASIDVREKPTGGKLDNTQGRAAVSYSYSKPDTTVLYLSVQTARTFSDNWKYDGLVMVGDTLTGKSASQTRGTTGASGSFSFYLEQHFSKRQTIAIDGSASIYSGDSFSEYEQILSSSGEITDDITARIKDSNRAYGLEADYIKDWGNAELTGGVSWSSNFNRSTYLSDCNRIYNQSMHRTSFFVEGLFMLDRFSLEAGMGIQLNQVRCNESGIRSHSWNPRPRLSVNFSPNMENQFRFAITSWSVSPSLSETSTVCQQTDIMRYQVGNTSLKTYNCYSATLRYGYDKDRFSISAATEGLLCPNAIAPYMYWDEEKLVTSFENGKGFRKLSVRFSSGIEAIRNWLQISATLAYSFETMEGNSYCSRNRDWSGNIDVRLLHWNFALGTQYIRAPRTLWGQTVSWGEDISVVDLAYKYKDWSFGIGMLMPFGKYDQGSRTSSEWYSNDVHTRTSMRIPYVSVGYNGKWGRQKRMRNKLVNNESYLQKSAAAGR